jgi:hypothetical protein
LRVLGTEIENQNGLMGHEHTMSEPVVGERTRSRESPAGAPAAAIIAL